MKEIPYKWDGPSVDGHKLLVCYLFSASEIRPDKKGKGKWWYIKFIITKKLQLYTRINEIFISDLREFLSQI
jgi:hypothetical protein